MPLSILASLVAYYVGLFLYRIWDYGESDVIFDYLFLGLFLNGAMGFVFVYAGSLVAPEYKKITSIVLATIGCTIVAISIIYAIITHTITFRIVVGDIGNVIGTILAAKAVHEYVQQNE